jgi:hypothetical protein
LKKYYKNVAKAGYPLNPIPALKGRAIQKQEMKDNLI